MRTRIKVCGITRVEDALAASDAGADAIGLVFYPPSPRALDCDRARKIAFAVRPFTQVVALFLDADADRVAEVLRTVPVDLLQFHGREPAAFCEGFGRRYIKALAMSGDAPAAAEQAAGHPGACGFLLDSHSLGEAGGTGSAFDWARYPREIDRPLILAGGLAPGNVAAAVSATRPWAVDVSSGVESAPGLKDCARIEAFAREVASVEDC
ncbi:phosphoribosylanthranilate isomerase [Arhodomonas sp. AD133]|uniref:phosphoribosylanthranilate isomerase n=1 Tax=Arhodomonas sp. AD133 TaxID=3415009 RepID=UPI003EBC64D6